MPSRSPVAVHSGVTRRARTSSEPRPPRSSRSRRPGRRGHARRCRGVSGARDAPLALHLQVGVQRPARVEPGQDVLAPRHHLGRRSCPRRSAVDIPGQRRSAATSTRPASASCRRAQVRKTVSPSGTATAAAAGRAGSARSRPPRGPGPAAGRSPSTGSPSTFSTVSLPRRVARPRRAPRPPVPAGGRRPTRTAACARPARRTAPSRPSTRTTRAPALRPGWWPPDSCGRARPGRAAPYGFAGSVAASTRAGPASSASSGLAIARSRSTAPDAAELGGAEVLDEVAATHPSGVLGGGQHPVDRGEAAGHVFGGHAAPRDHPVAIEQDFGPGHRAAGRVRSRRGQGRPSPGRLRRAAAPGHHRPRQAAAVASPGRAAGRDAVRGASLAQHPQRSQGVVADPSRPDQFPQRVGGGRCRRCAAGRPGRGRSSPRPRSPRARGVGHVVGHRFRLARG